MERAVLSGPGLYILIVAEVNFDAYTDPLGENRWPVERCRVVGDSAESFTRVARDVAFSRDGAIIVTGDGTIQEQMVRVRSPSRHEVEDIDDLEYADWMGTKHMSRWRPRSGRTSSGRSLSARRTAVSPRS